VNKTPFLAAILLLCPPLALLAQTTPASYPAAPEAALGVPQAEGVGSASAADDMASRLDRLEAETKALRSEVKWLRQRAVRLPAVEATPTGLAAASEAPAEPAPIASDLPTRDEVREEIKKWSWRKGDFTIVPYGILWGNTVYSTERTSPGSYTLYVKSPGKTPESECIVDARNTRLGFDVGGPEIPWFCGLKTGGKVEVDFQNSVLSTENKATIMLRHAYVEAKNDEWRLLAGQTWDVISPLYPGVLLYSVGWDAGNIGYRRAQVRAERFLDFSDTSLVTTQLSINQQVFEDSTSSSTGKPSDWPIVEGRVAWTLGERGKDGLPITVGLSGHIGEEENDVTGVLSNVCRRTWSGNVDLRVPLTPCFGLMGECYVGENLGAFLGGIGQGIDVTTLNTIRDAGGWFELWYDWTDRLHSHVGYSVDNPNDHDIVTKGERTYNQFYYGNLLYDLTKSCLIGVEISSWKTLYYEQAAGDSLRCEFAVKYGF
jgi:hypothetical protein